MACIKYALALSLLAAFVTAKTSPKPKVENVYHGVGLLSESPLWVNEEGALYWVDTESQIIFRLEIDTGTITSRYIGYGRVSLIARVKDYPKLLAISVRTSVYFLNWDNFVDDNSLRLITSVDPGLPNNRIDDGKVDAKGRFWFGTMGREQNAIYDKDLGSVYMMTEKNYKSPDLKIKPVSISNGIAWSSDNKQMYYVDSGSRAVAVYDFNLETGGIESGRTLFSFEANNVTGFPDGMTIDRDDNLWVACYLGGQVIKVDSSTGKLLKKYKLPTTRVTSVMWGGKDYSTLYVTTASKDFTPSELEEQPEAGSVFAITGTGSSGYPMNEFIFKDADVYHGVGLLSESPLWVNEEGALYWVDTESQIIFRLEIDTGTITSRYIAYGRVSLIARVKDYPKLLAISVRTSVYFLNWDTFEDDNSLRLITSVDPGLPNNRIDDGKVDAKGRFWFGTMGREQNAIYDKDLGSVYMMTEKNYKSPDLKIKPVSISNRIAWSSDNKQMYYVDSGSRAVAVYDFNLETGGIESGRTLFSFAANNVTGFPDGMTIDRDDNLWVACYLGGQVIKVDSSKLLKKYKLPTTRVTSVMWGGKDYSTLYVTTASKDFTPSELEEQPEAGSVFAITGTGSSGYPMNEFIFKDADVY